MREAIVIGAGVSGLTSAVTLLEAGFRVELVAERLPESTTSAVPSAIWYPFLVGPKDRVHGWAAVSYAKFKSLAADHSEASGVSLLTVDELAQGPLPHFGWGDICDTPPQKLSPPELDPRFSEGYRVTVPLIEMPKYLHYLYARFQAGGGGEIRQARISKFSELAAGGRLLVDCSGLGARELAGDRELYPVRGQLLRVKKVAGIDRGLFFDGPDPSRPTYVVPRSSDMILGVTVEPNVELAKIDTRQLEAIRGRAIELVREVKGAALLEARVGLRPCRESVRLEREVIGEGTTVIHNYGHGGSGVSLSWGCAAEVLALALETVSK